MGLLQDADFKTEADLVSLGATKSSLINDSKIYVTGGGINDRLDNAINNGTFCTVAQAKQQAIKYAIVFG